MKILAVGDIHLGRRPSRLPDEFQNDADELGPTAAWERIVDAAIRENVNVVVLAGDVIEREDDFFEGYRELEKGVGRLAEAGIQVAGIGGNHDIKVLPRLADRIEHFHLLGRDGKWESLLLAAAGEEIFLWGWSYPRERVTTSPLDGVSFERQPGVNLGLLHCDCDQSGSPYAPVTRAQLAAAGLDGWLLGHIHKPNRLEISSLTGYLGSISAMDSGELGPRGPWLIETEAGRIKEVTQWVLGPLRWQRLEVDLTGIGNPEEVRDRLLDAVRKIDEEISDSYEPPAAVGLRVVFTGRTNFGEQARALIAGDDPGRVSGDTYYFLERLELGTRPEIPLEELATGNDPAGLLARRLLMLDREEGDPERRAMLTAAAAHLRDKTRQPHWQTLGIASTSPESLVESLRQAGIILLEKMLAQTGKQS